MSNFTYAELDGQGDIRRLRLYEDELTAEKQEEFGVIPFVQDPTVIDQATEKLAGKETVVMDGVAHRRDIVVPKVARDFYREALQARRRVALDSAHAGEIMRL